MYSRSYRPESGSSAPANERGTPVITAAQMLGSVVRQDRGGPSTIIIWDVTQSALPGADLIELGLRDLADGVESVPALLVSIGAPRLRRLGIVVPHPFPSPDRRLYALLQQTEGDAAHARYNALIRRLVSNERAAECAR